MINLIVLVNIYLKDTKYKTMINLIVLVNIYLKYKTILK